MSGEFLITATTSGCIVRRSLASYLHSEPAQEMEAIIAGDYRFEPGKPLGLSWIALH